MLGFAVVSNPAGVSEDAAIVDPLIPTSRKELMKRADNYAILRLEECDYRRIDHCGWPPHPRIHFSRENCDEETKIDDFPVRGVCSHDLWQHFALNGSDNISYPIVDWNTSKHHNRQVVVPMPKQLRGYELTRHSSSLDLMMDWTPLRVEDCLDSKPMGDPMTDLSNWLTAFSLSVLFSTVFVLTMVLPVIRS